MPLWTRVFVTSINLRPTIHNNVVTHKGNHINTANSERKSLKNFRFFALILLVGMVSVLLHELGHCIFYWMQGIPAAMSLVKEFPLQDITATQYGIGSAGGPLSNTLQMIIAYWLHQKYKDNLKLRRLLSALIFANAFYFILRSLEAVLKNEGGELESAAQLMGLNYFYVVGLFAALTIVILYLWTVENQVQRSLKNGVFFLGLFFGFVFVLSIVHSLDRTLFWHLFPTIQIDDGRLYNEHMNMSIHKPSDKIQDIRGHQMTHEAKQLQKQVEQYLSDPANQSLKNAHTYLNLASNLLLHKDLLDFAQEMVEKGLELNTRENIENSIAGIGSNWQQYQNMEYGRLYGQLGWIYWKKKQKTKALYTTEQSLHHFSKSISPGAQDILRAGIIAYGNGQQEKGWELIGRALLLDTEVENQDPDYLPALEEIINDQQGGESDAADFIAEWRFQNAGHVSNKVFRTLNGDPIRLDQQQGKILFINFFSPACGSCRQEISHLKDLYTSFASKDGVAFYFILNRPKMEQEAISLFEETGISEPVILTIEQGSSYDLIVAEPTVWIVDHSGKVISKQTGYNEGDEKIYEKNILDLLKSDAS